LNNDPGVARHRLASLVLNGDPLHRELDDVRHVHGVPGSRLQLDKLEDTIEPVCAVQPGDELSALRPEGLLGVCHLCTSQFIGQATLVTVLLSAMPG